MQTNCGKGPRIIRRRDFLAELRPVSRESHSGCPGIPTHPHKNSSFFTWRNSGTRTADAIRGFTLLQKDVGDEWIGAWACAAALVMVFDVALDVHEVIGIEDVGCPVAFSPD